MKRLWVKNTRVNERNECENICLWVQKDLYRSERRKLRLTKFILFKSRHLD